MFAPNRLTELIEKTQKSRTTIVHELYGFGLKVSRPTIDRWEKGKSFPDGEEISKLAKFFGVKEQFFFCN